MSCSLVRCLGAGYGRRGVIGSWGLHAENRLEGIAVVSPWLKKNGLNEIVSK